MTLTGDALRAALGKHAEISLVRHDEDHDPSDDFDPEALAWVRDQIRRDNEWAWCWIEVRAEYAGFVGRDTLSGCSYLSEADFKEPDGYYPGMVAEAIADLARSIEGARDKSTAIADLARSIEGARDKATAAIAALGES